MSIRTRWVTLVAALTTAALLIPAAASADNTRSYEVTIYNLTGGQPFTPPLVATHRQPADLFEVGEAASFGVKEIAENGNLMPLVEALEGDKHVSAVEVVFSGTPPTPPLVPGDAVTFTIDAGPGAKWLSWVSMLICTNDGFTGVDSLRLPKKINDTVGASAFAYDAGTEINTEDFEDIVPPCPGLTGVPTTVMGTAVSDPGLFEGGVISHHDGVFTAAGMNTLLAGVHGWDTTAPVAMISVTRTG